ncbi:hypothetical protein FACS1894188_07050 [Clostridia bacterium]|nr:hypothetical protein FACS1894188_07050 [Clostridia bacterium]
MTDSIRTKKNRPSWAGGSKEEFIAMLIKSSEGEETLNIDTPADNCENTSTL